jgi:hypothetical protein
MGHELLTRAIKLTAEEMFVNTGLSWNKIKLLNMQTDFIKVHSCELQIKY